MRLKIYIDGTEFSTVKGCWRSIERSLTGDPAWEVREDWDVLDDLLGGGYHQHGMGEPVLIEWVASKRSRRQLGLALFERFVNAIQAHGHVTLNLV